MALLAAGPRARDLAVALAVGGSGVAIVGLMQWTGHDPFVAAGWLPQIEGASVRMRVYATLGNPNFVAGLLVGTVPLTVAVAGTIQDRTYRLYARSAVALQLVAIVATGSRAGALGVIAAAVAWSIVTYVGRVLLSRPGVPYGGIAVGAAALLVAAAIALQSEGRPLRQTLAGRIYICNIVSHQAWTHPWVGYGP